MTDAQRKEIEEMIAVAFGGPRIVCAEKPKERDWPVVIEPALGAVHIKSTIRAATREEAELKAKQIAREAFERDCKIQFAE